MPEKKKPWQSKTYAGLAAVVAGVIAQNAPVELPSNDAYTLAETITVIVQALGAAAVVWGRQTAKKDISLR